MLIGRPSTKPTAARSAASAGRQPPVGVADRDADGLGAQIEADQGAARRQVSGSFDEWQNDGHARTVSTRRTGLHPD
jgi:hypothetical protein